MKYNNTKFLPRLIRRLNVPPIKCQGIKTKLIPFIADNIEWDGYGRWIEPFLGSGVVALNLQPDVAILSDTNKHIIRFYKDIQDKMIDKKIVREYLVEMGASLEEKGENFYYQVREEFNQAGGSLPFLFLNRSCFNGMLRFNSKGKYNVPFGHKPKRFRKAYISKISNQVDYVHRLLAYKDWEFLVSDWRLVLDKAKPGDFVYLDPPYIGRHTDYYNSWNKEDAADLASRTQQLPCGYALSMWKENIYRKNDYLDTYWPDDEIRTFSHFYHVGASEKYRNEMIEALIIHPQFLATHDIAFKIPSLIKDERQQQLVQLLQSPLKH